MELKRRARRNARSTEDEVRHILRAVREVARNGRPTLTRGNAAVRRLDAIVINHLGGDEVTRTVWECGRRIGYRARAKRTGVRPARRQIALPLPFTATHARRPELVDASQATRETARAGG